jgi:hypothetical protein
MDADAALWLIVVLKGRQREVLRTVPASPNVH